MSEAIVIDNANHPLGELLSRELSSASEFRAASAFFNSGGLSIIRSGLETILENDGSVHIVHGADFRITDPAAVRALVELKMGYENMSYFVHSGRELTTQHSFHPKLYIATPDYRQYCAIVGSSNLTRGGMRGNFEVNTVIRGIRSEEPVSQCLDIFESILGSVALAQPDMDFVERYEHLHQNADRLSSREETPTELADLYEELIATQAGVGDGKEDWTPGSQTEFIVKAMENLAGDDPTAYLDLASIYVETERLARNAGQEYKWDTFRNSVRGRLNDNIVGKDGRDLFERRGGVPGRYGQYRLSDRGRSLVRENRPTARE